MGPYESENFKGLLLLQIDRSQKLSNLPNGLHKTTCGIFENWNFNDFFFRFR